MKPEKTNDVSRLDVISDLASAVDSLWFSRRLWGIIGSRAVVVEAETQVIITVLQSPKNIKLHLIFFSA